MLPVRIGVPWLLLHRTVFVLTLSFSTSGSRKSNYARFATKTAYRFVTNNDTHEQLHAHIRKHQEEGCQAVQLVSFMRHGSRNPGPKDIVILDRLYREHIKHHCQDSEILNWKPFFKLDNAKNIAEAGKIEQLQLASRFKEYFPKLFDDVGRLHFIASDRNRTIASCEAFQDGVGVDVKLLLGHEIRNDLMRFFAMCEKYLVAVENNPYTLEECRLFARAQQYQQVLQNVGEVLGLTGKHQLSQEEMKALYTIAGSELACAGRSPWVKIFTQQDLDVLEYMSDLKAYWKKGYGHLINYQQACQLLLQVITYMDAAVKGQTSSPKAVLHFGHAETILPVLCLLGLYRDPEPLTADKVDPARQFRTSHVMPFSANIAFVLYQCQHQGYQIEVLHNEQPVHLPICPQTTMCPYSTFKEHMAPWTDNCDLNIICGEMKDEL